MQATLRQLWQDFGAVPFGKGFVKAALIGLAIYLFVYAIERYTRSRSGNYGTRGFGVDLFYWFYYRVGIHGVLLFAPIAVAIDALIAPISPGWLAPLPFWAHLAIIFVGSDFVAYWIHRAEHRFKFMWAFHTTHHSQTHLNFATIARFHPVEMLYHNILVFIPLRFLGLDATAWLPLFLLNQLLGGWVHTQIPWKLGPLYRVVATPWFHSYHHSTDPEHYDRNFGSVFSLWDHLFGTAYRSSERRPANFGLQEDPAPTLASTLFTPFRLLWSYYGLSGTRRERTG